MDFISQLRWRPQIGDPSFMGWFTVAAYALAAAAAALTAARPALRRPGEPWRERVWWGVAMLLAFLCVNKQLDLQSLLTDIGRVIARQQGWYEHRRDFQKWAVVGVVLMASGFGGWFIWRFRGFWLSHKLLVAGLFFLVTFICVRMVSFHHVDEVLGLRPAGFKMNWLLELTGIFLVLAAAVREHLPSRGETS
ncbi:MAG TPA: hypothetical protein PKX23_00855 [Verrucomicrobiota bacterium]|nr:hypothetical protein [Verrucomicrobiota bacterium]